MHHIHSYLHTNFAYKCDTCAIRSRCGASPQCVVGDLNGSPKLQSFHTAVSEPTRRVSLSLSLSLCLSFLPLGLPLSPSVSLCQFDGCRVALPLLQEHDRLQQHDVSVSADTVRTQDRKLSAAGAAVRWGGRPAKPSVGQGLLFTLRMLSQASGSVPTLSIAC